MSGGSVEREHPSDVQCDHCELFYSSSGIIMHQAYCDGNAEPKDPTPQPIEPTPASPENVERMATVEPPQATPEPAQQDPMVAETQSTGEPAEAAQTGQSPTAPEQCPSCGGALQAPQGLGIDFVEGQSRGLLQTAPDDRICASCGLLVEADGTTEELVSQQ